MTVHIQRPTRAPRTTPNQPRPASPPPLYPMGRAVLHALAEHRGPMLATALAERTGIKLASLKSTIWSARSALMPLGGHIWTAGSGETLTYEIEIVDPGDVHKIAGAPVPRADLDAYLGLAGINATVLRAVAEADGAPVAATAIARLLYDNTTDGALKRVRVIVLEVRRLLANQQSALTIVDVDTAAGPALMWATPITDTPAPARRTSGITLPPCGYAEWSYQTATGGAGGRHAVVFAGEDQVRILTETDRSNGMRTDQAPIARIEIGDTDA